MMLFGKSFRHGVHPDDHKGATCDLPIERLPFGERYILPLGQHIGAPSRAVVSAGDKVVRGQRIAEPGGFVSTSLHSPVSGEVVSVSPHRNPEGLIGDAIEIRADPYATQRDEEGAPVGGPEMSNDDFVSHVQRAGLVGLGGAAFPSHVKYKQSSSKPVEELVINGSECEPYLTCDHRYMVESAARVIRGSEILGGHLGARRVSIGVELNKREAIESLEAAIAQAGLGPGSALPMRVVGLKVKYPQGAEKMLIKAMFGREVPGGKLPLDLGMVVNNVSTVGSLADYFDHGRPLIERVLTVSGPGIARPANLLVPLGTSVRAVVEHCGGLSPDTEMVVLGGPMMGRPTGTLDVPVLKGTSGILAFTADHVARRQQYDCVRCGRCLDACAVFLNPSRLARLAQVGRLEEMERLGVQDCMECGGCTFACPSGIPIVQLLRTAKVALRQKKPSKKGS